MSNRRNQNQNRGISNPAKIFLEFQGSEGHFYYYDKGTKSNITVKNPSFLLITDRTTITGWNRTNGGIYSNEIEDIQKEELDVRYFKGNNKNIAKGLYSEIKDKITAKSVNAKFTKAVYCLLYLDKEWTLCCIKMTGKQITSWIDVLQKVKDSGLNEFDVTFKIDSIEFDDSGAIKYYFPKFGLAKDKEGNIIVLDENNPSQKKVLNLADDHFDVLKDYFEKKKNGETGESNRKAQSDSTSSPEPQQSNQNQTTEEEDPFTNTSNNQEEEEEDDLPW